MQSSESNPFDSNVEQYENWFDNYAHAYASELHAVRSRLPQDGRGLEVGVGTGRFAAPLEIQYGVEPSVAMGERAKQRGVQVVQGKAEALPFPDQFFDYVLFVTTICFLDDVPAAFREARRVLKRGGYLLIGLIDRNSILGQRYEQNKEKSPFYRTARFRSTEEIITLLQEAGFTDPAFSQTLFGDLEQMNEPDTVRSGYGEGAFVVVRGERP